MTIVQKLKFIHKYMKTFKEFLNEVSVLGAISSGYKQGGIGNAATRGIQAIRTNIKNRGIVGAISPTNYSGARETAFDTAVSFINNPNRGGMTPREKVAVKQSGIVSSDLQGKSAADLSRTARRYGNVGLAANSPFRNQTPMDRMRTTFGGVSATGTRMALGARFE